MSASTVIENETLFDPAIHLAPFSETDGKNKIMMSDLGFPDSPITKVAATHPFPLFTPEAIRRMRAETVKHSTIEKYMQSDNNNPCVVRGHAGPDAPFLHQAWNHPETRRRINEMAGLELEIVFDYEIGHTNIQLGPRGWAALQAEPDLVTNNGTIVDRDEIAVTQNETPNWHFDSYPFVCIVMLSESTQLQGGQTIVRNADGSSTIIPLPGLGGAVILHGGYLCHAVAPTDITQERMAMVTSYRPKDPLANDTCVLRTVRMMSDVPALHQGWSRYRLQTMAARCLKMAEELESNTVDIEHRMEEFQKDLAYYLDRTVKEMTEPVERVRTNAKQSFLDWQQKQAELLDVSDAVAQANTATTEPATKSRDAEVAPITISARLVL